MWYNNEDEILWCNSKVLFDGKPLAYKHWSKCDVQYLSDIITNKEIDEPKIKQKILQRAGIFFEMHRLKAALPLTWKDRVPQSTLFQGVESILSTKFEVPGQKSKELKDLTSKDIYQIFILNNKVSIASKRYWQSKFPNEEFEWQVWFKYNFVNKLLPRKCKDFNWRIFYGQVNTEMRLKKMKYSNGICTVCNSQEENLEHLLLSCTGIQEIWKEIEKVVKLIHDDIELSTCIILTGFFKEQVFGKLVNVIMSICRWNIWKRRNLYKYEKQSMSTDQCLKTIKIEVKTQLKLISKGKCKRKSMNEMCKTLMNSTLLD